MNPTDAVVPDANAHPEDLPGPARILLVGIASGLRDKLVAQLHPTRYRTIHVERFEEAESAIAGTRFDLILLNPSLPDGDGFKIAQRVSDRTPATKIIVLSDAGSFSTAIRAMRCGVTDISSAPFHVPELLDRIEAALRKALAETRRESRIHRLHRICKELTEARDDISSQVDLLCNDLIAAYQEMSEQMNDLAISSEFRAMVRQELDVEELLRTTLAYLLGKTGPTNAAVFLPDSTQQYALGAYVNYDCPRESIDSLLLHLCDAICPQMARELEIVAFDDAEEFAQWIGVDDGFLAGSQVVAFSCDHEGECLAVVVLFRSAGSPFDPDLAGTLNILRAIFAEQLANIVKMHHRASPSWPDDPENDIDDEYGFGFDGLAA